MPRPLKVFKTHIGFYDMVVAAPSMKAAADAWHASPRLFAQGLAGRTDEAEAVEAALQQPGIVLQRPHGKKAPWRAEPEKPVAPKQSARQKQMAAAREKERKRRAAAAERAAAKAARKAREDAAAELADIEEQEARLRARRQALRKKFHLRAV